MTSRQLLAYTNSSGTSCCEELDSAARNLGKGLKEKVKITGLYRLA